MRLSVRLLFLAPCAALLFMAASTAHAQYSVSGEVFENGTTDSVPAAGSAVYSTTPTATFTVTSSSATNLFNFNSNNGANDYTLTNFLKSGGDGLTYSTGSSAGGDSVDNDLFQFTGTTTLVAGTDADPNTYTFEHDDGLILYLTNANGTTDPIDAPGQTGATPTSFTVCPSGCNATGGTYSFTLDYAEVAGPPAVLTTSLPLTTSATPEPSSLILLGTGLLGVAGMARRRMKI